MSCELWSSSAREWLEFVRAVSELEEVGAKRHKVDSMCGRCGESPCACASRGEKKGRRTRRSDERLPEGGLMLYPAEGGDASSRGLDADLALGEEGEQEGGSVDDGGGSGFADCDGDHGYGTESDVLEA